jgi:hypothetical protein
VDREREQGLRREKRAMNFIRFVSVRPSHLPQISPKTNHSKKKDEYVN